MAASPPPPYDDAMAGNAGDAPRHDDSNGSAGAPRPGPGDLIRSALVDDQDPRFPWWVPLPGLVLALSWAGYEGAVAGGASTFLSTLFWPGAGVFVLITVATYFGWQLDID